MKHPWRCPACSEMESAGLYLLKARPPEACAPGPLGFSDLPSISLGPVCQPWLPYLPVLPSFSQSACQRFLPSLPPSALVPVGSLCGLSIPRLGLLLSSPSLFTFPTPTTAHAPVLQLYTPSHAQLPPGCGSCPSGQYPECSSLPSAPEASLPTHPPPPFPALTLTPSENPDSLAFSASFPF